MDCVSDEQLARVLRKRLVRSEGLQDEHCSVHAPKSKHQDADAAEAEILMKLRNRNGRPLAEIIAQLQREFVAASGGYGGGCLEDVVFSDETTLARLIAQLESAVGGSGKDVANGVGTTAAAPVTNLTGSRGVRKFDAHPKLEDQESRGPGPEPEATLLSPSTTSAHSQEHEPEASIAMEYGLQFDILNCLPRERAVEIAEWMTGLERERVEASDLAARLRREISELRELHERHARPTPSSSCPSSPPSRRCRQRLAATAWAVLLLVLVPLALFGALVLMADVAAQDESPRVVTDHPLFAVFGFKRLWEAAGSMGGSWRSLKGGSWLWMLRSVVCENGPSPASSDWPTPAAATDSNAAAIPSATWLRFASVGSTTGLTPRSAGHGEGEYLESPARQGGGAEAACGGHVAQLQAEHEAMRTQLERLWLDIDDAIHNGRSTVCWPVG